MTYCSALPMSQAASGSMSKVSLCVFLRLRTHAVRMLLPAASAGCRPTPDCVDRSRPCLAYRSRYLREWVTREAASRYVLSPEVVVERSHPRSLGETLAGAHFELEQHIHRSGDGEEAVPQFRESQHLDPGSWTNKRQGISMAVTGSVTCQNWARRTTIGR